MACDAPITPNVDVTNSKLDNVLNEVVTRSQNSNLAAYAEQWKKCKKLDSIQVLEIFRCALVDENLNANFNYFSLHQRCEALFSNIRNALIVVVESLPEFVKSRKEKRQYARQKKQDEVWGDGRAEYLLNKLSGGIVWVTISLLLADPKTEALASALNIDHMFNVQKLIPSSIRDYLSLRLARITLDKITPLINETIEKEGDAELKKSDAICVPSISEDWQTFFGKTGVSEK